MSPIITLNLKSQQFELSMHADQFLFQKHDNLQFGVDDQGIVQDKPSSLTNIDSVDFKPSQDPDQPPQLLLSLQQQHQTSPELQSLNKYPQKYRTRTRSQDNEHSFIGFLQRKIKVRLLSQELSDKLQLDAER